VRVFQVVKRQIVQVVERVDDVVNFTVRHRPAVRVRSRLDAIAARPAARTSIVRAVGVLLVVGQAAAGRVTAAVSGATSAAVALAPRAAGKAAGVAARPLALDRARVERVTIALRRTTHADGTFVGGTGWTNAARATGKPDGVVAEFARNSLANRSGVLECYLPVDAGADKDALAITRVRLRLYWAFAAPALSNAEVTVTLLDRHGAEVLSFRRTTAVNALGGQTFDVTAARAWTWELLGNLPVRFDASVSLGGSQTIVEVDAVELLVDASRTDDL
jgi:hypothetical protein